MVHTRSFYKNLSWKLRRDYDKFHTSKLLNARFHNAKEYWKLLKGPTSSFKTNITNHEFYRYFKDLSNPDDPFYTADPDISDNVSQAAINDIQEMFSELDCEIDQTEIMSAVKQLKRSKSPGDDLLVNELFIYGKDALLPHLTSLFNFIFNSGFFPSQWSNGLIIPLHKKGDVHIASNYRGITLLNVLGKLFTRIINTRLDNWAEIYGVYIEAQNGFRRERGTIDNIFILQQLMHSYINNGKPLYTCFIDFSKAFDYIVRDNLWYKLLKCGLNGKILKIIMSMYKFIKSQVFIQGEKSSTFACKLGVRQGECLSPILFALYVNDMEENLRNVETGISVLDIKLFLLFYADDAVILADTAQGLQLGLDSLYEYCQRWKLKINTNKSKIMIFRKGSRLHRNIWKYGDESLEVVNALPYLGILFSSSGSFSQAQAKLAEKANRALFSLYQKTSRFRGLDAELMLDLFDKLVMPILNYAAAVWGFDSCPQIERIHTKFCKRLLGVKISTQNNFVYGELGRFPLRNTRILIIVKYWLNIVHGRKPLYVNLCYQNSLHDLDSNNANGWTKSVRDLLFSMGFGEVWYNQGVGNCSAFISEFKQRSRDIFQQNWSCELEISSRATFYRSIRNIHVYQPYLAKVRVQSHRQALCRLITSSHTLRIESGRWDRPQLPRNERFCFNCVSFIEDEYHFVLECPLYAVIRQQLIPRYYTIRPSMLKLVELFNTTRRKQIIALAKYTYKAFQIRQTSILAR